MKNSEKSLELTGIGSVIVFGFIVGFALGGLMSLGDIPINVFTIILLPLIIFAIAILLFSYLEGKERMAKRNFIELIIFWFAFYLPYVLTILILIYNSTKN